MYFHSVILSSSANIFYCIYILTPIKLARYRDNLENTLCCIQQRVMFGVNIIVVLYIFI